MSIYCVSDIHGCFSEFIELLDIIKFNPDEDTLYVLGDVIDRGTRPIECLRYIMRAKGIRLLLGNHEQMMMDFYDFEGIDWSRNGNLITMAQFAALSCLEKEKILSYLQKRPLYKTLNVCGRRFFLSHAGLDVSVPFKYQHSHDLLWSRPEFYKNTALSRHICIFGHTPTPRIRGSKDCSVWFDPRHKDKINIDCGCVYGGALAAIRLDDGETYYVKSKHGNQSKYCFNRCRLFE